ncbi:MAG: hypothetical protein GXC94_09230 [Comamonadaceae bacterium]|jgi:hypothetical protein|nr:hypothetical protein [Comamonadaceae bacterium]
MSVIVSGLIGGAIAAALTTYIAKKAGKAGDAGSLHFGTFLWGVAFACLGLAILPVAIALFAVDHSALWTKAIAVIGFGVGAIYCFAEAAFVKGSFDSDEITFSTPWSGRKQGKWQDLQSVQYNDWANWYTLRFGSGTTIRLSRFLSGHLSALEAANARVP